MTATEPGGPGTPRLRADARRNRARILSAAEAVFAEKGVSASTDEVAERAGVAIGTVFRHFPAKRDLLAAIMKDLLARLSEEAAVLGTGTEPGTALFTFFARVVEEAARKKTVVGLLAETGVGLQVADPVRTLRDEIAVLLARAQEAGTVRRDVHVDEIVALLTSACQGVLHGGWDDDLRRRTLGLIFAGLRPGASPWFVAGPGDAAE